VRDRLAFVTEAGACIAKSGPIGLAAAIIAERANPLVEDRRRKIGARLGGGSEIGSASFQV
jgi:thioredoxin reductase